MERFWIFEQCGWFTTSSLHELSTSNELFYNNDKINKGLPWWLSGKESAYNAGDAGDMGSIPGLGKSPGGGHGNLLQYSCLENPMDRGAW